ncbi:hypothetical protein CASFOL_018549 [Castilleja foliolosa]|uniref:Endonuclease/exonuclease/phosphatase domain-containing protein n=1 Tax=Castilleja foliolosa TaxID=1961234 RepID=A0ABD3D728_9LAMI
MGKDGVIDYTKKMIMDKKISILAILEPKKTQLKIQEYATKLGFNNYMHGGDINQHIWIFWKDNCQVVWVSSMEQAMTVKIKIHNMQIYSTFVYAQCTRSARKNLWDYIDQQQYDKDNWILGGDFNCVLKASEKSGGNHPCITSISDFNSCLINNNLSELNYKGNPFTWGNNQQGKKRIWEKLNRILMNGTAFNNLPDMDVIHLPRSFSDHAPLWFKLTTPPDIKRRFRFQKMWIDHKDFKALIAENWNINIQGHIGYVITEKLRRTRKALKHWN